MNNTTEIDVSTLIEMAGYFTCPEFMDDINKQIADVEKAKAMAEKLKSELTLDAFA